MEKEHEPIIEEKRPEVAIEFWNKVMQLVDDDDVSAVEHMFLERPENLMDTKLPGKLPGEDKLWAWLQGRAENKLGRSLLVELNEKGIIVPK